MTQGHSGHGDLAGADLVAFAGADGNTLVGEWLGAGPPVVLLHGGGQTRQSWTRTARQLAASGRRVLMLDLRGHGDSDWSSEGRYALSDHVADLRAVLTELAERPAIVGASMGGITALLALGHAADGGRDSARCLVLVDVAPSMESAGLGRVRDFMRAAPEGFASVEEAADAVAAYLPGRARPPSTSGLRKNLRLRADNRYHWHWDPRVLTGLPDDARERHAMLARAAIGVRVPTMLLRGARSDVVSDDGAAELRRLIPQVVVAEVGGAGHTLAGDDNDDFSAPIVEFVVAH